MTKTTWNARTRQDLIIEVWEYLDCESVGARELEAIQQALQAKFGAGGLESPAVIARAVADEGAVLRHPEVFDYDVKWRKQQFEKTSFADQLDFRDLSAAFESVVKIEEARIRLQSEFNGGTREKGKGERGRVANSQAAESKKLREIVTAAREELLLRAHSKILEDHQRRQAKEISHWLTVWLQSAELFSDWLDLRRRSAEFREKFPEFKTD